MQGACAESDPVALKVHASLLQMKVNLARCLPCDTQAEIGRCVALPGGRPVEASRKRRKEASMWDTVVAAAMRSPDLLYADEAASKVYFLLINPEEYDRMLSELKLPS